MDEKQDRNGFERMCDVLKDVHWHLPKVLDFCAQVQNGGVAQWVENGYHSERAMNGIAAVAEEAASDSKTQVVKAFAEKLALVQFALNEELMNRDHDEVADECMGADEGHVLGRLCEEFESYYYSQSDEIHEALAKVMGL